MTAHDDPRRMLGAMKAGADDYERKSIDLDALEARGCEDERSEGDGSAGRSA